MLLRDKDKKQIIYFIKKSFKQDISLLAFGSRINGQAHDMSDLDLVIKTKDKSRLNISDLETLRNNLRNSTIPIIIQVIDWYSVPTSFHKNILDNCKEINLCGNLKLG